MRGRLLNHAAAERRTPTFPPPSAYLPPTFRGRGAPSAGEDLGSSPGRLSPAVDYVNRRGLPSARRAGGIVNEPLKIVVRHSGRAWEADVPSVNGCSARGSTRDRVLAEAVECARQVLGPGVTLLVEEHPVALVGVSEAASILGWDRRKVAVYAQRGRLPRPVAELAGGRVWRRADIEGFRAARSPRKGDKAARPPAGQVRRLSRAPGTEAVGYERS